MRPDELACANCCGPVSEGRCPVCRASRDQFRRTMGGFNAPLWLWLSILALLVCLLALEAHFA
ncbi:hypothetical protein KGA66_22400 [Actinocrinis puniceicyclus]|uniref:Uncharacterized protein n=1 Tax=Actinocrinis puniceicyclus TaxID=977794 RepID=A0A8J7WU65_9ACTN|nr:hypothetical protein [Actinocrinis puniceicyclus]MBS2965820.1 hypothetical protein [Actinocrinis puniceicyclus]